MRKRSRSREYALQILYQLDITHDDCQKAIARFWDSTEIEEVSLEIKSFTTELVQGVVEHAAEIDEKLRRYATNWQLERMAVVDRNILRLSACELMYRVDIPPKVAINEAVDLAKRYSGIEAGKFVNAILDKIKIELKK